MAQKIFFYSLISILLTSACNQSDRLEQTEAYRLTPEAHESNVFSITANGKALSTEHYKSVHVAHFASGSAAEITIEASQPVYKHRIFPGRFNIRPTINGNKMTFTMPESPSQLILKINNFEDLILVCDAPEENTPDPKDKDVINVADHDIDNTGETNVTRPLQTLIDENAGAAPKKTIYFPRGIYKSANILVPANIDVYLEDGAILKGTGILEDYTDPIGKDTSEFVKGIEDFTCIGQISFINAENSKIYGRGIVDAQGDVIFDKHEKKMFHVFYSMFSKNVELEGVTLRNTGNWTTVTEQTSNAVLNNVKVITVPHHEWADGFGILGGCSNIKLNNCFAYCNDDPIAINNITAARKFEVDGVYIKDFIGWNPRANGVRIGFWMWGDIKNLLFENVDLAYANKTGLLIHPPHHNDYRDLKHERPKKYENIRFINTNLEYCERLCEYLVNAHVNADVLQFENCSFDYKKPSTVKGYQKGHPLDSLIVENLQIDGKLYDDLQEAWFVNSSMINHIVMKKTASTPQPLKPAPRERLASPTINTVKDADGYVVNIASNQESEIRYTLDGSEPVANSRLYNEAFRINKNQTVHARSFSDQVLPGYTSIFDPGITFLESISADDARSGLAYAYYLGTWDNMPDFNTLTPATTGTANNIVFYDMLQLRDRKDGYAMVYTGYFDAPASAKYTFNLVSDDGSKLYINNQEIVDHDGVHASVAKEDSVYLKKGRHAFRVEYFEKVGGESLNIMVAVNNNELMVIPDEWLSH
ncbi:MAG: hypothetical protein GVY19_00255 [Bacteroidetes bacterium]|nr:hypothetical protein [Bacteroidota bacterium]